MLWNWNGRCVGIGFPAIVRLWLTLSWADYTMNMAWYQRLHEFLPITTQALTLLFQGKNPDFMKMDEA
jgi:hypothetical protein